VQGPPGAGKRNTPRGGHDPVNHESADAYGGFAAQDWKATTAVCGARGALPGCAFTLAALFVAASTVADSAARFDRVSAGVNTWAQADGESRIRGRLGPGDQLRHLGLIPRWHKIKLSAGQTGFVSSRRTEIIHASRGPLPLGWISSSGGHATDRR